MYLQCQNNINVRSVQFYCPRETTHYFEMICLSMQRKNMLHLLLKNLNDNGFFSVRLLWFLRGHWFFSSRPQRPMTSDLRIFYPRSQFLRKSQYFRFWMFSAKQGHYWYHFYNVFGMTRSLTGDWTRDLTHSMPALYH